jgi:hypothetical protein
VIETLGVLAVVGTLAVVGVLGPLVPPEQWMLLGAVITGVGLLAGVPTGLWYHVALYRCLQPRTQLPPRWWLDPVALHGQLLPGERRGVLTWFTLGGIGFAIVVLGCALTVLGLLMQWLALRGV